MILESWQKKAISGRALWRPARLTLLAACLVTGLLLDLVFGAFWPALALVTLGLVGFVVWYYLDLNRPAWMIASVLRELELDGGLSHKLKSRLGAVERVFSEFWRLSASLDRALVEEPRREALQATLELTARLRAVGLADRLSRQKETGSSAAQAETLVESARQELEAFAVHLGELGQAAAQAAASGSGDGAARLVSAARELGQWRTALAAAQDELKREGF